MNTATVIAALRALWKAIKWRVRLARKRTDNKPPPPTGTGACITMAGLLGLAIIIGAGCARFDAFWVRVGDTFGIEQQTSSTALETAPCPTK